jgi:hypothetical protein
MRVVVYVPRSGSRFYASKLAEDLDYEFLGEVFNTRTYPDPIEHNKIIHRALTDKNIVCKVDLIMLRRWYSDLEEMFFNNADQIDVIYRKDFNAQVHSLFTAMSLDNFHNQFTETKQMQFNPDTFQMAIDYVNKCNELTADFLKQNAHKDVKLVHTESFATPELKYQRKIQWDQPLPNVKSQTVELFND